MKAARVALECLGTLFVAAVVLMAGFMLIGPRFGWNTHPVLSGSMEPTLKVGGIIVTRPVRVEDVQVGDIITFQRDSQRITHRVIEIVHLKDDSRRWFRTKGDANQEPDGELVTSKGEFVPKTVAYVPFLGFVAGALKSRLNFLVMIGVPAVALVAILGHEMWKGLVEERRRKTVG